MNRIILTLALSVLLVACAGSPFRTRIEAEQNRENLFKLNVGLTKDQVLAVMGQPYKTEMYVTDGKPVEFWLYLTEGKSIDDLRLTDSNFTPLAFENGILKGWGRNYYDTVLRIKKEITIEQK
jgi:hypothetical protein